MKIKIKLVKGGRLPEFKTAGAVCADCYARLQEPLTLEAGETDKIPLGFCVALPRGYEMIIRPRSSLNLLGIHCAIGTIDEDYRGEVCAIITNHTGKPITIENGNRICQLAIRKVPDFEWLQVDDLDTTERGSGGFGSTGK